MSGSPIRATLRVHTSLQHYSMVTNMVILVWGGVTVFCPTTTDIVWDRFPTI